MHRSLVDDLTPDSVTLAADERHHVERVLRMRAGDELELVDGRGGLALARWAAGGVAHIERRDPPRPPTTPHVVLAVAPPRLPRLDWLVEKACELDVNELQLLETRRAERVPGSNRLERLQRVADQALMQCRRLHRMRVHATLPLEALLARPREGALWLACPPRADAPAGASLLPPPDAKGLLVLVGPEGGLDPEEEQLARAAGARAVALGATTLRVETAALAMAVLARAAAAV